MQRSTYSRVDPKRRAIIDSKKRQFAQPEYIANSYEHRLNFYDLPPTANVTLEEFELWAIARLKVLSELETCQFRNKSPEETLEYMEPLLRKHLPLSSNHAKSSQEKLERRKDHYSHFILRLAFSQTEELRRRFTRLETMLFRIRYKLDDTRERNAFIQSLDFDWEMVDAKEEEELREDLVAASGFVKKGEEQGWFKVEWERVPDLVEQRRCLLKRGMAYVPLREQMSLIVAEFSKRVEKALELTARAIPRLDEDDRLTPILTHLSKSFTAPDTTYDESTTQVGSLTPTAGNIDSLSKHFPLCMSTLHTDLRKNSHLKHYGRLQYTLFLKGLGLSLEDCILFWRRSFKLIQDDKFDKEYKYNIRHAYGDVGGDANRRGRGYTPYSCSKLLTEALPGSGQSHGCPYRTYSPDNLVAVLQNKGLSDGKLLKEVREDVGKQRFHIACGRVFEYQHSKELKQVKEQNLWPASELDTILHPNDYFKRSFLLKHLGEDTVQQKKEADESSQMEI